MNKNEMIEKLQREIFWIDVSIKRMEKVWKSGGYHISLTEDVCETITNLRDSKNNLTEILNALQLESSAQTKNNETQLEK